MDGDRFDHLARSLRSRRGALAAVLGGGLAARAARPAAAGAPSPCTPNGEKCDPSNAAACCTGTCKKRKGKFMCAPAGQAFGCGKRKATDVCQGGGPIPCPDHPTGTYVVVRTKRKKRPLCMLGGACADCRTDADCADLLRTPTARCVKPCPACGLSSTTLCAVPA